MESPESDVRWDVDVAAPKRVEVLADKEAHGCQHGHSAVLHLHLAVEPDLALAGVGAEAGGVPEGLEALEGARHAARRHVVRLDFPLALVLDQEDGAEDLELAQLRHRLPLLQGPARRRDVGEGHLLREGDQAGEVEAVVAVLHGELVARRDQPAEERRHAHAPVLQLGVAHPRERRRRAEVRETKRVPDLAEARLVAGALPVRKAVGRERLAREGAGKTAQNS